MKQSNELPTVNKIFALSNEIDERNTETLREELIHLINNLINNDFNSLIQLLYRIDVDENKLKENLKQREGADTASLITDMIIKRQLQKIKYGKKFPQNKNQPGEERW